ncbi:MAG: M55 family metallopeptidase [Armatimonadota bacterium]|jgi:D-amino peptidase
MKLYLMTDLEGVAGVYTWENREDESLENHERRCRQRRWLAHEVSSAVDGFFAGGASDVIVNDGHGAGYTIDLEHMDPRAQVINGRQRPVWLPYLDETCDATGIVGAHAKANTPSGCLCHTMSSGIRDWSFNGISLGEMGIQAAIAGHYGVPFVFVSGDAHACKEMEELIPGIVTVPVKTGTSRFSAIQMAPGASCAAIGEGAERAMQAVGDVEPFKLESPILFRDEREEPTFDEENPAEHCRVINARTREVEAEDIIDLMHKIYSYPEDWKPLEFVPAWRQ